MFSKPDEAQKVLNELQARLSDALWDVNALSILFKNEELVEMNYNPEDPLNLKVLQDLYEAKDDITKLINKLKRTV